jgi:hypothetical protein
LTLHYQLGLISSPVWGDGTEIIEKKRYRVKKACIGRQQHGKLEIIVTA